MAFLTLPVHYSTMFNILQSTGSGDKFNDHINVVQDVLRCMQFVCLTHKGWEQKINFLVRRGNRKLIL